MEVKTLATSEHAQTLSQLVALLDLLNHRNKNQHRRSLWWRHFSTFRRQLKSLTADLSNLTVQPESHVDRVRLKVKRVQTEVQVSQRIKFWRNVLASKWHRAFSQLAADGRFAHIGLVLLAIHAEVCHLVGITAQLEDQIEAEMQETLLAFGYEQWQTREITDPATSIPTVEQSLAEDFGIAVTRDMRQPPGKPKMGKAVSKIKKAKRSKNPTGNAIDDLFNGM